MTLLLVLMQTCIVLASELEDGADDESDGLKVEIIHKPESCETSSQRGNVLKMHYTGYLLDGQIFDSSIDHDSPFTFELGAGEVIKGFEQGLVDMCIGEKRKLTVPPHLAYGDDFTSDKIPPKSTLIYDVELLKIDSGSRPTNFFNEIDTDGDNLLSQDEVSSFIRKQEEDEGVSSLDETSHNALVADIFLHEDYDKDGYISHSEFSGPKHEEL